MPSSESILEGLTGLATTWQGVAVGFHVFLAVLVVLLAAGVRVSRRLWGIALCLPLASVSVLAWAGSNPFTGVVFTAFTVVLAALSLRLPAGAARMAPLPVAVVGFVLLAFGWVYPHFLHPGSLAVYLYAAPVGIVPCPTLSVVLGIALVLDSFRSRRWGVVAAAVGLFYGLFGTFRLGVALDWGLVAGAAALLVYSLALRDQPERQRAR